MKRAWMYLLFAVALLAGVLFLVACGEEEEAAEETPAAVETTAPAEGETPEATVETEEEGEEGAEFSPSALEDLDSYRYKAELSIEGMGEEMEGLEGAFGMSEEGAFVAPDSYQAKCSVNMGSLSMEEEVISIAGETWVKPGDSPSFEEGEPTFCTGEFTPSEIASALSPEDIRRLKGDKEEVNGVDSIHYSLDKAALEELLGLAQALGAEDVEQFPEDVTFDIDIWLAEDGGWPVKTIFAFSGEQDGQEISFQLEANVTDVNDSSIKIEAP
ncbi:MAG: hypothetical protein OEW93_06650 [Candidatus Bathyarchaeota archaeon]|nr:hypothetical protein [Candidatus Bathyarchaeota archaeon]